MVGFQRFDGHFGAEEIRMGAKEDKIARPTGPRRRGIQSVEIGLKVLQALAGLQEPSALGVVAQATGMASPQVHRYLQSLISAGMAQQLPDTGRYDLGPAALKLGLAALGRIDAFRITDTAIMEYSRRTGRTVQVAALGPLGPTIIRWVMGRPPVVTSFNVGSVLPLLHSATGRVFVAFMPQAETQEMLSRELKDCEMTRKDVDILCGDIRRQGFAQVDGTMIPGLLATAFPIFDLQGRVVLTATAVLSAATQTARHRREMRELGGITRNISIQLGWKKHLD